MVRGEMERLETNRGGSFDVRVGGGGVRKPNILFLPRFLPLFHF